MDKMDKSTYKRISDDLGDFMIPVGDMLPPEGEICLWVSETGAVEIAEYITDAVAWMPLPKR